MAPAVIDGGLVDGQSASISVFDDGLLRGDGVFEVIRLYEGKPFALDEHLERMALSARNMRLEFSLSDIAHDVDLLLSQLGPVDVWMRLVVTRGGRRIALIEELTPSPATIALAAVEYAPAPLMHAIKSLSYGPNMLAVRLACEQGAGDALFVTADGRVLEASRASFFYVLDARLYTPPLDDVLDSITRRHLLAATDARERTTSCDDLADISEAFIASTTKEVLPVHAIDGRALPLAPGPSTRIANTALHRRIREALGLAPLAVEGSPAEGSSSAAVRY